MIVLEVNNVVATLQHRESVPRDMHEVIGYRLPDEIYYLVSIGALAPAQLNMLLGGIAIDGPPLVDSEDYRRMLNELTHIRTVALAILTSELNEFFAQRKVITVRWYDEHVDLPLNHAAARAEVQGAFACLAVVAGEDDQSNDDRFAHRLASASARRSAAEAQSADVVRRGAAARGARHRVDEQHVDANEGGERDDDADLVAGRQAWRLAARDAARLGARCRQLCARSSHRASRQQRAPG